MIYLRVFKRHKVQALSTRVVIVLAAAMLIGSIAVLAGVCVVLYQAGFWWLAVLISEPLLYGLFHSAMKDLVYCRPGWFKPEVVAVYEGPTRS